jgi:hypothetical protein
MIRVGDNLFFSGYLTSTAMMALHSLSKCFAFLSDLACFDMNQKGNISTLGPPIFVEGSTKTMFYRAVYSSLENTFIEGFGFNVANKLLSITHVVWAGGVVTQVVQPGTSLGSTFESGDADGFVVDLSNVCPFVLDSPDKLFSIKLVVLNHVTQISNIPQYVLRGLHTYSSTDMAVGYDCDDEPQGDPSFGTADYHGDYEHDDLDTAEALDYNDEPPPLEGDQSFGTADYFDQTAGWYDYDDEPPPDYDDEPPPLEGYPYAAMAA